MSIIHDAFKKAQQGLEKSTAPEPLGGDPVSIPTDAVAAAPVAAPASAASAPASANSPKLILTPVMIGGGLTLILLAGVAIFMFWPRGPKQPPVQKHTITMASLQPAHTVTSTPSEPVSKPSPVVTSAPLSPTAVLLPPKPLTFTIGGVMAQGNINVTLINNNVYQEGEEIDGIKIIKITLQEITVLNNGQEQIIRVGK